MSRSLRILACIYFFFAGAYAILSIVSNAINGVSSFATICTISINVLIIVSVVLGVYQTFRSVKKTISYLLLPIFMIYASLLASNIISLVLGYNVILIVMLVFEVIFIIAMLISITVSKYISHSIPLIVGAVSAGFLIGIVSLGFLGMLLLSVHPIVVVAYVFLYILIILALITFLVFFAKRKQFAEETNQSAPLIMEKTEVNSSNSNSNNDAVTMLKELKVLLDSGAITQEEYEEKRKQYVDKL